MAQLESTVIALPISWWIRLSVLSFAVISYPSVAVSFGESAVQVSEAQVIKGQAVFEKNCSGCHGRQLTDGAAPPLAGPSFVGHWFNGRHTVRDLYTIVATQMPLQRPGSLSAGQYVDAVSFILARNGVLPSDRALTPSTFARLLPAVAAPDKGGAQRPSAFPGNPQLHGRTGDTLPDDESLQNNGEADWLTANKGLDSKRYSPLTQINTKSASGLRLACVFDTGETVPFEDSPIIYDQVMYIATSWSTYAVRADTCEQEWKSTIVGSAGPVDVSRGVSLYRGKVFRTSPDGRLWALDAKTGDVLWVVWVCDPDKGYWLSAAPAVFRGKVVVGEAGADWGINAHVHTFDSETGAHLWTFDIIPARHEAGASSWGDGREHGGGSVWSTPTVDPKTGLVYISTGNPAPSYDGAVRPGDNLYTDSVVVLDLETGLIKGYVQQIRHDVHDWDTSTAPLLYGREGHEYMAVATKGGWLYIYDRPGLRLHAREAISRHTNESKPLNSRPTYICPGFLGGAEWNGASYDESLGRLYVNSVEWCGTMRIVKAPYIEGSSYYGGTTTQDPPERSSGWTRAFDAVTGRLLWSRRAATPMVAGITSTAGGVLFTGDVDGNFLAISAQTGDVIYQYDMKASAGGAPSTYLVNGRQYVAQAAGRLSSWWHSKGSDAVFVFSAETTSEADLGLH